MPSDDARLLTMFEMAMHDWLDAHPGFTDPILIAVFAAGFDAGGGTIIDLIASGKWNPYRHAGGRDD